MAKSPAERWQELNVEVGILRDRDATRLNDISLLRGELKDLEDELKDERNARQRLENELIALKQQLTDHLAQYQERDKRRWGIFGILIGALLSLASGLVIASLRR